MKEMNVTGKCQSFVFLPPSAVFVKYGSVQFSLIYSGEYAYCRYNSIVKLLLTYLQFDNKDSLRTMVMPMKGKVEQYSIEM